MEELNQLKRRITALKRDEEAKRRRVQVLGTLGVGSNAASFLNTSGLTSDGHNGLASNDLTARWARASLSSSLGMSAPHTLNTDFAPDIALRQLICPATATAFHAFRSSMLSSQPASIDDLLLQSIVAGSSNTRWSSATRSSEELLRAQTEEALLMSALTRPGLDVSSSQVRAASDPLLCTRLNAGREDLYAGQAQPSAHPAPMTLLRHENLENRLQLKTAGLVQAPSPCRLGDRPKADAPGTKDGALTKLDGQNPGKDFIALGVEEDINWLSEMHCFLRSEIVEVFHVKNSKLTGRSTAKGLSANQVGIRCRWCANMPPESRVSRSSAFPSSLRQLYQSFTMMVRDHFGPNTMCTAIPPLYRDHLNHLRNTRNSQGASDSKHYWIHAAHKIGMVDTEEGIQITEESKVKGQAIGNFGAPTLEDIKDTAQAKPAPVVLLVKPDDLAKTNMFFYTLLLQTQMVYLQKSELVAKRRTLPEGLEGIGCRHCCAAGRYGFSRRFPLRRRSLPEEIMDIYCHMKRCTLCPNQVKEMLKKLFAEYEVEKAAVHPSGHKDGRGKDPNKEFFDIVWRRLGRTHDIKT